MVVLSASVTSKNGRVLFARQFVEMNRLRIEGLLAAFPKLMGAGNKQHTFIETDSVRYVWQPVESIYLLLITNKASNIARSPRPVPPPRSPARFFTYARAPRLGRGPGDPAAPGQGGPGDRRRPRRGQADGEGV